ncbi:MAG: aldo/keto reductase [Anaerolineales bacterium]|nr:MAG: aldo/keto reductase [Anaerolineales bacterium]
MHYRDFGKTGLKVSQIAFGGGAVGGLLIDKDDAYKVAALQHAMDAGINWVDTAPAYGQGQSEAALGWLLKKVDPVPYVSTKVRLDTDDLSDIPGQVERSLVESFKRLQRDAVTLVFLHNQIGESPGRGKLPVSAVMGPDGVLESLERLREQGLFKLMGITAMGELPGILEVINSGRLDAAQVYYNMLNPSAGYKLPPSWPVYDFSGILEACHANGVAAMNIRIFSAGVIATDNRTGRESPITHGDTVESEARKAKAIFDEVGLSYGTRAQTALRFGLAQPMLSSIIVGLAEMEHLDQAIEAENMGPLPQAVMDRIQAVYQSYTS